MDEDVVAGQDPGQVALEEVDNGQSETAGVVPGGVLEEIEKGDGPGEASGVGFVGVDSIFFAVNQVGHESIILFFRPTSSIRRAAGRSDPSELLLEDEGVVEYALIVVRGHLDLLRVLQSDAEAVGRAGLESPPLARLQGHGIELRAGPESGKPALFMTGLLLDG
jgi:hypothetical protein